MKSWHGKLDVCREAAMTAQFRFVTSCASIVTAPTAIGHLAVASAGGQIAAVPMAHPTGPQAARRAARVLGEELSGADPAEGDDADLELALSTLDRLVRLLEGEPVALADVPVKLDHLSPFQQRVVAACRAVPYGRTRTYG